MSQANIPELPHGHGGSFKKGIVDGLMGNPEPSKVPNGHDCSYRKGLEYGQSLQAAVAEAVKK